MKIIDAKNIKGNFFGGMPFDANWSFAGADSPSKLVVSVVNESGDYGDPEGSLGFERPETVTIGNFKFQGYLVSYEFTKSPEKKILVLTYVDQGTDLDRYFVGLNHRWGKLSEGDDSLSNHLILVGKSYHPCDQDLDSTVEYKEVEGQVDPCDPCPEMPLNKYDNACDEVLEDFNIFEVYYTFNELLDKIKNIFNCEFDTNDYKEYKSTHVGPLRQVLNSWCSDLGLAFFWDPINNTLNFISRKNGIKIPDQSSLENNADVIDLDYGSSVENTFTQGSIGYFGVQGSVENYVCEQYTLENLNCLSLGALAEDGTFNSGGGESGGGNSPGDEMKDFLDYQAKEIAVALSYYSSEMRDAILWFNYYGIYEAKDLVKKIAPKDSGAGPSKGKMPTDNKLSFFGEMEILDVYGADLEDAEKRAAFTRISNLLSDDHQKVLNLGFAGPETRGTLENPNYYFFIARCNEDLYEKEKTRERELASNFMGKFWSKEFDTTIPNASNSKTEVTIDAPDGNGSWYYKNSQIKSLSIFDFGHEEGSYISQLDDKIAETETEYDEKLNEYIKDETQKEFIVKGFILHEREPKWDPDKDFAKWYESLFSWYAAQTPRKMSQGDGRPEIIYELYPESLEDKSIRLYIARKGTEEIYKISIKTPKSQDHPKEAKKRPIKNEIDQDIFGEVNIREVCSYGLGEQSKYVEITIGKDKDMIIHTPPEAFERVMGTEKDTDKKSKILYGEGVPKGSTTGFDVIAHAKSDFQIYFPKYEYASKFYPQDITKAASILYHYEQIKEDNLNVFRKNTGNKKSSVRSNCQFDKDTIDEYMEKANKFTHYKMVTPQKRASFRVAGVFPLKYGLDQGLTNVSIIVNDAGVFTDYVLEDKIISPPSINVLEQNLRNFVPIKKLKSNGSVSPINTTNIKKYQNAIRNI